MTPDQLTRMREVLKNRSPLGKNDIRTQSRILRDTRQAAQAYQERLALNQQGNREQRRKSQGGIGRKPEIPPVPAIPAVALPAPNLLRTANPNHLTVKGGKLAIWDGKPELAKPQGGFKTKRVRSFKYAVEVDGKPVVLNRHTNTHEYLGIKVYGVPSLTPKLAELTPKQLASHLAKYASGVEHFDVVAPKWLPTFHGKVSKDLAPKEYGEMQLHHINQWSKARIDAIAKDHLDGKITLDEAKARTSALLQKETRKKKNGDEYEVNVYSLADKKDRAFVVLPAGLHDATHTKDKILYHANHPSGIDVEAPGFKLRQYALPDKGEGGRDWYKQNFQKHFWREVYRRESYVLLGEINRRIRKGEITPDEVRELYNDGLKGVDSTNRFRVQSNEIKKLESQRKKAEQEALRLARQTARSAPRQV